MNRTLTPTTPVDPSEIERLASESADPERVELARGSGSVEPVVAKNDGPVILLDHGDRKTRKMSPDQFRALLLTAPIGSAVAPAVEIEERPTTPMVKLERPAVAIPAPAPIEDPVVPDLRPGYRGAIAAVVALVALVLIVWRALAK